MKTFVSALALIATGVGQAQTTSGTAPASDPAPYTLIAIGPHSKTMTRTEWTTDRSGVLATIS